MNENLRKKSKFLYKILRHDPKLVGIALDEKGWAKVSDILMVLKIKKNELDEIVETNDKKRFEFDNDQIKIRARQGHSIKVDVELQPHIPNHKLYHGTASKFLPSIKKHGITKQSRNHVHLSDNIQTAIAVGSRHGSPVILEIDAVLMYQDGFKFYKSNNNVYLTDHIQPKYIINILYIK
jgi:putative RNA 2'-phosphotransferase